MSGNSFCSSINLGFFVTCLKFANCFLCYGSSYSSSQKFRNVFSLEQNQEVKLKLMHVKLQGGDTWGVLSEYFVHSVLYDRY